MASSMVASAIVGFDWSIVWKSAPVLSKAARLAVTIAIVGSVGAIVVGMFVATCRLSSWRPLRMLAFAYTQFFRGVSLYVLLIWLFFGVALAFGWNLDPVVAGTGGLILLHSGYMSEIFRAGIQSIDVGQPEAGRAIGLNGVQVFRYVTLPQAFRAALPATGNQVIDVFKDTSILAVIGVRELFRETQRLANQNHRPFEYYTATMIIYLIVVGAITLLFAFIERRMRTDRKVVGRKSQRLFSIPLPAMAGPIEVGPERADDADDR